MIYFLTNILILSISVIILVFLRVKFYLGFGKDFFKMLLFLVFMVLFNFVCVFNNNVLISLSYLVFLSFYSMFLILYGYGTGFKVVVVILFKGLADILVIIILGNILFLQTNKILDSFLIYNLNLNIILITIFLIYSLLGVFGFWLFWAMEASYFISCFMHSCGFISIGLIFIIKFSILGYINELNIFKSFINLISLLSYILFLFLFFSVKDCKKSFGFYSASSISLLMFNCLNFPNIAINYFFLSSVIKIIIFECLSYLNKSNKVKWIIITLLLFNVLIYSLFFIFGNYNNTDEEFIYLFLTFKVIFIVIFIFKVFNMLNVKVKDLSLKGFIFIIISLILNKIINFIIFNSLLNSFISYSILLLILFNLNIYSFNFIIVFWNNMYNNFNNLTKKIINIFKSIKVETMFFKNLTLFSIFKLKNQLNKEHLILYCFLIPLLILLIL